jgi:two-component system cell cycle response regulator
LTKHPPPHDSRADRDSDTDDLEINALHDGQLTQTLDSVTRERNAGDFQAGLSEADVILIAHPESQRLGTRYRLSPGASIEVGRSPSVGISLPEVMSISRKHARLRYVGALVTLEDLESTNGTFVNGKPVQGRAVLRSGDRFQTAAVHFKFLHERDVESAYHLAIYELVARDGLTEIFNKRKYEEEMQREFARARRHVRNLGLILFDVDQFKRINDSYGHLCGDFVLKKIASTAREIARPEDVLARVGGDEFAILLPETGLDGARALAERLRDKIEALDHRYGDCEVEVHCTYGIAVLTSGMQGPQDLYEAADQALLTAKREGRNRIWAAAATNTSQL